MTNDSQAALMACLARIQALQTEALSIKATILEVLAAETRLAETLAAQERVAKGGNFLPRATTTNHANTPTDGQRHDR